MLIMETARFILAVVTFPLLAFFIGTAAAEETCCERDVATMPITMPEPEEADCTGMLNGAINQVLTENYVEMDDCPVEIEVMDWKGTGDAWRMMDKLGEQAGAKSSESASVPELVDYLFRSTLSLASIDEVEKGEWEEGYEGRPNWGPGYVPIAPRGVALASAAMRSLRSSISSTPGSCRSTTSFTTTNGFPRPPRSFPRRRGSKPGQKRPSPSPRSRTRKVVSRLRSRGCW